MSRRLFVCCRKTQNILSRGELRIFSSCVSNPRRPFNYHVHGDSKDTELSFSREEMFKPKLFTAINKIYIFRAKINGTCSEIIMCKYKHMFTIRQVNNATMYFRIC